MGRSKPVTAAELKRQLILQLDSARLELARESRLAQVQFSPTAWFQRSLQKHRIAWAVGGVFAGLALVRLVFPSKFRSDKSSHSDKTRGISGIARGLVMSVVQRAALNFARNNLKDHAQRYFDSLLKRPAADRSPPSHVASS